METLKQAGHRCFIQETEKLSTTLYVVYLTHKPKTEKIAESEKPP